MNLDTERNNMKTKLRNRYYCDFCKKSGGHAGYMRKHESRCTLNPDRHCGFCDINEENIQPAMKDMLALLPDIAQFTTHVADDFGEWEYDTFDSDKLTKAANEALIELRKLSDCPGCIMAALRQKGIPVPLVTDFSFKEESKRVWSDFNESQICGW